MKETIDCTPTWSQVLQMCLMVLESKAPQSVKDGIKQELARMAELADLYVASQKEEKAYEEDIPSHELPRDSLKEEPMCEPFKTGEVMLAFHETRPKGLLVRALEDSADGPDFYTPIDDFNNFLDPLPAMSGLGYGVIWKGGRWEVVV